MWNLGDRVCVAEDSRVCSYLWGHTGKIVAVKPPERCYFAGPYVVAFDEPRPKPGEYWTPLATCAFEADQIVGGG